MHLPLHKAVCTSAKIKKESGERIGADFGLRGDRIFDGKIFLFQFMVLF